MTCSSAGAQLTLCLSSGGCFPTEKPQRGPAPLRPSRTNQKLVLKSLRCSHSRMPRSENGFRITTATRRHTIVLKLKMTRIALQPQCSRLPIQLRIRAPGVLGRAGLVRTLSGPDISVDVELFLSSSTLSIPDDLSREPERVHFDTPGCGWPRAGDPPAESTLLCLANPHPPTIIFAATRWRLTFEKASFSFTTAAVNMNGLAIADRDFHERFKSKSDLWLCRDSCRVTVLAECSCR